jgi:hypothetical protein
LPSGSDAKQQAVYRKAEANYERDKAEIARKRQPALARSESHDVGHAGGEGEYDGMAPKNIANASQDVIDMVRRSLREKYGYNG